jgi:hypothetical protein
MPDSIEVVMKRWRENRDSEWSEAMEADALRIADHACDLMPKLVEAIRQADRMLGTCCLSAADEAIFDMLADALAVAAVNATKGKP